MEYTRFFAHRLQAVLVFLGLDKCLTQMWSYYLLGFFSGDLVLTNHIRNGHFTSPNYPNSYPHNIDCMWTITVPTDKRVQVDFIEIFDIEPVPEYVACCLCCLLYIVIYVMMLC